MENLELHGERAALRGNPSFVWRAGQDRRLDMILQWGMRNRHSEQKARQPGTNGKEALSDFIAGPGLGRVLVDGCGVGMYIKALLPFAQEIAGIDIEWEHLEIAVKNVPEAQLELAACEALPYPAGSFDLVLSHEVLEHVNDDRAAAAEMVRVLTPGGRAVIFVPNRLYPFETHGHYWRGDYHFGNTPLINYLPDGLRNRLAPHVRAYTAKGLRHLFLGQPVRIVHHTQIYPGYDNIAASRPELGRWIRRVTYGLENTPLKAFGLSHLLVVERV
jgi:SAM-dependent methyltransferase